MKVCASCEEEARRKKEVCRACEKKVKEGDKGLQCDGCESWAHITCEEVKMELYEGLEKSKEELWFCRKCKPVVKRSINKVGLLEEELVRKKKEMELQTQELEDMKEWLRALEVENRSMAEQLRNLGGGGVTQGPRAPEMLKMPDVDNRKEATAQQKRETKVDSGVMGAAAVEKDCVVESQCEVVESSVETKGKASNEINASKGEKMGVEEAKGEKNKSDQKEKDSEQDHTYNKEEEKKHQEKDKQPRKDQITEKPPSKPVGGGGMESNKEHQPPAMIETQLEERQRKKGGRDNTGCCNMDRGGDPSMDEGEALGAVKDEEIW
ncbi:uncharacterized protein LOC126984128 [Eriocheir sinensis]|uniref:uncharacterized protein LOC126984128 n=1 Tax=Eriocheir sinensis TaxID=95602 RepID=UPI0021C704F5|nr:uncharacterized protein LOC126984128 [Eriocheir sinensis]